MSDRSAQLIETHERFEPHETDEKTREAAAARLWATGDQENINTAEEIWKELKTPSTAIQSLKELMTRLKKLMV